MPWINKPQKKNKNYHSDTDNRLLRQKAYNTTAWRKLRAAHIVAHPLCEECLKQGKVNAGTPEDALQVHHIASPFKNGVINYNLLLDDHNLMTLCSTCHNKLHNPNQQPKPEDIIKVLDDLLLNDNWDDDTTDNR